jgi:hypothetical protein
MKDAVTEKLLSALDFNKIRARFLEILDEVVIQVNELFEAEDIIERVNLKLKNLDLYNADSNRASSINIGSDGDVLNQSIKYLSMGIRGYTEKHKKDAISHITENYIIDMMNKTKVFQFLSKGKRKEVLEFMSTPEFLALAVNARGEPEYSALVDGMVDDVKVSATEMLSIVVNLDSGGPMPLNLTKAFEITDFWVHPNASYVRSPINALYYVMNLIGFINGEDKKCEKKYFDGLDYKAMETENQYLKFKIYKNGNAKVWIKPPLSLKPIVDFCVSRR